MNKKEIAQILKFSSPNVLYVVDENNQLLKLECPFKVLVLVSVGELKKGVIESVSQVKVTNKLITVFCVKEKLYWCCYFEII